MKQNEITICGHGSGVPTTKVLEDYCAKRNKAKADNGKNKGLVCVLRFLKTEDQTKMFHDLYKTILGRNIYSQNWRRYVYEPKDGKYYSDCSSSGCYTYDRCGVKGVKDMNTAEMYYTGEKLDVRIINGQIAEEDLDKLRVGDALMFRGNDPSRPLQIGHVEYIYELPEKKGTWEHKNGAWYYTKANGQQASNEWVVVNHHWYWFDTDGKAARGYREINGGRYYFETSGDYECALMHTDPDGALILWEV